jgi:hypothetical protein
MKKSIVLAILGIGVGATASYGQGYVNFSNYTSVTAPTINFAATGVVPASKEGLAVGGSFFAELLWFNGLTSNPLSLTPIPSTITYFSGGGPALNGIVDGDTADGAGWFLGPVATLTPYTSGLATFQVIVSSAEGPGAGFYGSSGLFTMTPATGSTPVPGFDQLQVAIGSIQYDPGSYNNPLANGSHPINSVPEPTTMALGALGGLSLLLFRRKQA